MNRSTTALAFAILTVLVACGDSEELGSTRNALTAECLTDSDAAPTGAWICGEDRTEECSSPRGARVDLIHVRAGATCEDATFTVSDAGPFYAVGDHPIQVTTDRPDLPSTSCSSTLHVVDTQAPVLTPKAYELWPPNHKFRKVVPSDCIKVQDACTEQPELSILWASSDEPRNDTGDGNTETDIQNLGCDSVELLAERKGNGDARVYRLGIRARDTAGHVTDGVCEVIVPHDQGGKAPGAGPEAYRLEAAPACGE